MAESSRPHPVSVSAHFLSSGKPGPVTITPGIVNQGRTFCTVLVDAEPPVLPAPERCVRIEPHPRGFPPNMLLKLDMRLHPEYAQLFEGRPSGKPRVRGWIKMADDEPIDAFGMMLVAQSRQLALMPRG